MNHNTTNEDEVYLQDFMACRIDPAAFHHRQHLRIAYTLLAQHDFDEACDRLREGILELLNHLGAGTAKYHDTMTKAWLLAVAHFMHMTRRCQSFDQFVARNAILLDQSIMHTHYTGDLLKSDRARREFVEPDLEPIPVYAANAFPA